MKRAIWQNLVLALTIGVSLTACDVSTISSGKTFKSGNAGNNAGNTAGNAQRYTDSFLNQTDGSAKVQSGRSILKDTVAMLQADVDIQVGSSLADDPTFGSTERSVQAVSSATDNKASNTNTSSTTTHTSVTAGNTTSDLQKYLAEIQRAAQPYFDKLNKGQALSEDEKKKLDDLKKRYEEVKKKLETTKPTPPPPPAGTKPPPKPPEPPRVDPGKKPEPPKEHNKPTDHAQQPSLGGGVSLIKAETGSASVDALRKKLEELQAANERLRKEQEKKFEELRRQNEELKRRLEDLAKKKVEHERKKKEEFKQTVTKDVFDNGDGTFTYTMKMSNSSKGATISHEVQKTVDSLDKTLVSETSLLTRELPNGVKMAIGRTFKQNEDGSTSATFDSEIVRGDKVKKASWNKTTNADGSSSAEGTITRPDGTVIRISIERDPEGTTKTVAEDSKAKVKAEVEKGELDTTASAKLTDTAEGKIIAEVDVKDTENVHPDAD